MYGRAIIAPLSFGDSTLPKIAIEYVKPLNNALYDWSVDNLPAGPLTSWPSLIDGTELATTRGVPTVTGAGTSKAVRFADERMQSVFDLSGPHTLVTVFRLTAPVGNHVITWGRASDSEGVLKVTPAGDNIGAQVGSATYLTGIPSITPNTAWHVAVVSFNGPSSAFRFDDKERVGTLADAVRQGLTLGYAPVGPNYTTPIEYKRVAILAGGTTAAERGALVTALKAQYAV